MSLLIRTDVTAVKLLRNIILAGIGSSAFAYCKDNLELLYKIKCLEGQKIYGFKPCVGGTKIIVYGGKQFTVISLQVYKESDVIIKMFCLFGAITCKDWLHSVVWVDDKLIGILTAHNTVQMWNISRQELVQEFESMENSILYSGLLIPLKDDFLVFAGTVFSEVIIHSTNYCNPLHYLKGHRGVIFSISANFERRIIVTTSDDRSVRIWTINPAIPMLETSNTTEYWQNVNITCAHEVYGHTARVMRSCITDKYVISVGEDSAICFWDDRGQLAKKTLIHQNGGIWSVDADNTSLLTGAGDCGVVLHPLTTTKDYDQNEVFNLDTTPKKIAFTSRRNLVILDDKDNLIYNDVINKTHRVYNLNHNSTYKLLSLSNCKQLIAVADMTGKLDVFAENCKDEAGLVKLIDEKLMFGKLLSMHWAGNRHLVFCAEEGKITIICYNNVSIDTYAEHVLPHCKERWLTSVAMDPYNKILVVGDRCGNIHIYCKGYKNPIKSFKKCHGRYGPTSITIKDDTIITTGRDGTIKYFALNEEELSQTKHMSSKELEFQWVEQFIDKDLNKACGFQERIFVIYDVKNYSKILEVPCGGGHRSWDVTRYIEKVGDKYDEFIRLVYLRNSDIHSHIFQMSKIVSRNIVNSSHSKEINCLKSLRSPLDKSVMFYVTGGEDTTLRISLVVSKYHFEEKDVFKHLSNVRSLKLTEVNDRNLIVSVGGRAQICIRSIQVLLENDKFTISSEDLVDFLIKGTDKERKNNLSWKDAAIDFDPETRIMDLDVIKVNDTDLMIFTGCSDACLRIFSFVKGSFQPVEELRYHKTCILKTVCIKISNRDILITGTTRGQVALWDVTVPVYNLLEPYFVTLINKAGINSIDVKVLSDLQILIATGGDDNAVYLSLIEIRISNINATKLLSKWYTASFHCSQVTGVRFVDDYLLSTSIDQRITVSQWRVEENEVFCDFLSQAYSDVADIQGLEVLRHCGETATVCVYGKGMEVLEVHLRKNPD